MGIRHAAGLDRPAADIAQGLQLLPGLRIQRKRIFLCFARTLLGENLFQRISETPGLPRFFFRLIDGFARIAA